MVEIAQAGQRVLQPAVTGIHFGELAVLGFGSRITQAGLCIIRRVLQLLAQVAARFHALGARIFKVGAQFAGTVAQAAVGVATELNRVGTLGFGAEHVASEDRCGHQTERDDGRRDDWGRFLVHGMNLLVGDLECVSSDGVHPKPVL